MHGPWLVPFSTIVRIPVPSVQSLLLVFRSARDAGVQHAHRAPYKVDSDRTAGSPQQKPVVQKTAAAGSLHSYRR